MNIFQRLTIYFIKSIQTRNALLEKIAILEEALDAYRRCTAVLLNELEQIMPPEDWEKIAEDANLTRSAWYKEKP